MAVGAQLCSEATLLCCEAFLERGAGGWEDANCYRYEAFWLTRDIRFCTDMQTNNWDETRKVWKTCRRVKRYSLPHETSKRARKPAIKQVNKKKTSKHTGRQAHERPNTQTWMNAWAEVQLKQHDKKATKQTNKRGDWVNGGGGSSL
jgi:hypothetical protein